ncbi:uncharacterized protein LOC141590454 [Silene latifolia]|uniref:uncharacterized protein LOC141590454 n=1 Tax=Silene latifolia TaxID=37657 RepID=UPI003D7816B9
MALQYPLLFPCGEDGYRLGISHSENSLRKSNSENPRDKLTLREWYAFRIQDRPLSVEFTTLLQSGKAYHQFLVDGFASVESHRLKFIRYNQDLLRVDNYNNLRRAVERGDVEPSSAGSRLIVPSSLVGGGPYMRVNYLDTMTICRWFGYPDLFITFTCNPKWPEITRFVRNRGLNPEDRPDILSRVFKIKLEELMIDLKERHIFGRVRAVVYTIEFQKRGLPHAHILLFLHREDKFPEAADIDKIISAEILNPVENPVLHAVVCTHMIHGPCGTAKPRSPCMVGSTCSKHFPKKCTERTTIGEDGYPIYKRSKTGSTIYKDRVALDNGSVVPYNPYLLLKYRAHINVEWCNQSKAIKYLFKYINVEWCNQCYAYGLIGDDKEYIDAIEEVSEWASGFYLRNLFATLLLSGTLSMPSLELTDEELKNYALIDIEASLQLNGSSLARFEGMPLPDTSSTTHHANTMVMDELSYDKESLQAEHASQLSSMTDEAGDDPRNATLPFGGKVVVFGGDFRQTLPVVSKGSRADVVHASLCSSYLWSSCKVLTLTKNMRLQAVSEDTNVDEIRKFSEWITKIGDGLVGDPNDDITYHDLQNRLWDPNYLQERAILAPTHEIVEDVNDYVLSLIHEEERIYLSYDEVGRDDRTMGEPDLYSTRILEQSIKCYGLPNHELRLKVGAMVMLLRNIDQSRGLCNGTVNSDET